MGKPRKGTAWMVEAWATCQAGSGDSGDKTDEGASRALSDGQSPEHGFLAGWSAYVSAAAAAVCRGFISHSSQLQEVSSLAGPIL